jgi:hypothetical protein
LLKDKCVSEKRLTRELQKQIINDLNKTLGQMDDLQLWLAGAHLASAIEAIKGESLIDQSPPKE